MCFLCGMMVHVEEQCEYFEGHRRDDKAKSYGRWFQMDVLDKDYRRPEGKRFGLDAEGGWVIKVSMDEDIEELMDEDGSALVAATTQKIGKEILPDLNDDVYTMENMSNNLVVIPFLPMENEGQLLRQVHALSEDVAAKCRQPLRLFGLEIEPCGDIGRASQEPWEDGNANVVLSLTSGNGGEFTRTRQDYPQSVDSDPFNLAPFIFGLRSEQEYQSQGKATRKHRFRHSKSKRLILPELGKRDQREKEERGLYFTTAKADGDQPRRAQ